MLCCSRAHKHVDTTIQTFYLGRVFASGLLWWQISLQRAVLTGRRFLVQFLVADQILESVLAAGEMPRQLQSTANVPMSKVLNSKMLRASVWSSPFTVTSPLMHILLICFFKNLHVVLHTFCFFLFFQTQQHGIVGFKKVYFNLFCQMNTNLELAACAWSPLPLTQRHLGEALALPGSCYGIKMHGWMDGVVLLHYKTVKYSRAKEQNGTF